MDCRTYGQAPYSAVVVHGGPGAPGSASSLALALSSLIGTIEPFQTAYTIKEQIEELSYQIDRYATVPFFLFGHSWGAWLSFLLANSHPNIIRKIFLIGSGAFDALYVQQMEKRRLSHLSASEAEEYKNINNKLSISIEYDKNTLLTRLGQLAEKADNYCVDPIPENNDNIIKIDADQYNSIWTEASQLRSSGYFINILKNISIPIRIIHGANDPTPITGVVNPIKNNIQDLSWYELQKCGHSPWKERYAKGEFWRIIKSELV